MKHYEIILKGVPQPLTYCHSESLRLGSLVKVSLGKRTTTGIITKAVKKPSFKCSEIIEVILEEAVSPLQLELCRWVSHYYCASFIKCLRLFVPTCIWSAKRKAKHEELIILNQSLEDTLSHVKRSKKQQELVQQLSESKATKKSQLEGASTPIIKALLTKELISISTGKLINPDKDHKSKPHHDQPLTDEQQQVLKQLRESKTHQPYSLLHGVTGSGKTEIYLQLIRECVENNQQAILLVPEIALTTELIQYFSEHFEGQISILHSHLNEGERLQAWHRIHNGDTKLILGSRSALFTPWKNLNLIIIDEEHEWTYKQESSPRYHAKTVAENIISRLPQANKPRLVLGSATPSVESYYQTQEQERNGIKYQLLELTSRATTLPAPPVTIVDLRKEFEKKNFSMFSDELQQGIQETLERKEQVVLFLNKRGASSSITCRDCGYTPICKHCDVSMTYHQYLKDFQGNGLICHYCGTYRQMPETCPDCSSAAIRHLGVGTQKAEAQLQDLFPGIRILRADKDSTGGRDDFERIYYQMKNQEADVLLGTQMISKGLDLPNVTLTGVLLADIGMHLPDYRASERVFQLMTQVAGRSGRHKPGRVIIQSYQPDHPAIQATKNYDYQNFYQQEIQLRQQFHYPPFTESIRLTYKHPEAHTAAREAQQIYTQLDTITQQRFQRSIASNPDLDSPQKDPNNQIDLSPHYIPRLHGKYLWNIHLRGEELRDILKPLQLPAGWTIDIDPR